MATSARPWQTELNRSGDTGEAREEPKGRATLLGLQAGGPAHLNGELVTAARAEIAKLQA